MVDRLYNKLRWGGTATAAEWKEVEVAVTTERLKKAAASMTV